MQALRTASLASALLALAPLSPAAQHAQVSAVVANPSTPTEIWVANRGNDSVSVVDTTTGTTVAEVDVGVWPRSLAFSADGALVFVANQRGNVPVTKHFVTPFDGTEKRGTVSVVDVATRMVTTTLEGVGTEPYGLAVAPNGQYFGVTGFQSGTMKLYRAAAPFDLLASFAYDRSMSFIPPGKTVSDVDSNTDMIPDLAEPRAFTIRADSQRIFVTHSVTGYVSVLDVTLDGGGLPTAVALATKIDLNTYAPHPIFNPIPVQTLASQGTPRFLDDIALSPDGTRALVPHLLHNVNHDVNHVFPGLAGDFANRVYPALTVLDAANATYAQPGDDSSRLHHELSDTLTPAEHVPYGGQGRNHNGGVYTLGSTSKPLIGGMPTLTVTGTQPGDTILLGLSPTKISFPIPPFGTLLNLASIIVPIAGTSHTATIPNDPSLDGQSYFLQAAVFQGGMLQGLSNGLEAVFGFDGLDVNEMGYRAGHPGRVLYNAAGDRAVMLNRGSEDVFLYEVDGSDLRLLTVFPPRHGHVERAPLDTATPLGDLPLGMALVEDPSTTNDDGLLYVVNETTRTLSTLRVDYATGVITKEADQIGTLLGPDQMTLSERQGQELFEDASRAQTAGNFNNSCGSCHFEGGADGNVWQRSAGPRSTMPVYGGSLLTGLILWKGVRLQMGETGPMFGGENGGTGIFTDTEQQALTDYHNIIPVPLNPNLDPVTGDYSPTAALGKDLYFGTDDTGLNPTMRTAGCFNCHPDDEDVGLNPGPRGYTKDFLDPLLTDGEMFEALDPSCFSLQENIVAENIRNINSGVNVDENGDTVPDFDRNLDGIGDAETYAPMNVDDDDDFTRDDPNSYLCPQDPMMPAGPLKVFTRGPQVFSIPTKLGVFSTGPYMHDHSISSLRTLLDPAAQVADPQYGNVLYPGLNKFLNEFHDIRGDDSVIPGLSKVQTTLDTLGAGSTFEADIEALLAYISSL